MPKIEPFEKHSTAYDDWFLRNEAAYLSELKAVGTFIPSKRKGLEVGVGSARFALPLGILTGIDPSPAMAKLSRRTGVDVIQAVAESLPFERASFDFCLMVTTICFVDDLKKSFQEIHRVLHHDGFIVVGFINKASWLGREYLEKKPKSKFYGEAVFYSVDEVIRLLNEAGFTNYQFRQTLFKQHTKRLKEEPVKNGCGKGAFVVIQGYKKG